MRPPGSARGPRPTSVARVPGIDYDVLDTLLGYALRRAQIAAFDAFYRATAGHGITPPRFTALVIVGANPGLSQTVLGRVLGIARSGAMLLTDWLVRRKLAERRPHPEDRRSWGLFLTLRGESLLADLKRTVRAHDGQLGGTLTETQRRTLLRLLRQLAE
ncbi:MAG: MarR family transcriptional regulator [Burkholderiales bacterium]|nr:MarR family transcriptional regulator [Burkholderiales bacterium]